MMTEEQIKRNMDATATALRVEMAHLENVAQYEGIAGRTMNDHSFALVLTREALVAYVARGSDPRGELSRETGYGKRANELLRETLARVEESIVNGEDKDEDTGDPEADEIRVNLTAEGARVAEALATSPAPS